MDNSVRRHHKLSVEYIQGIKMIEVDKFCKQFVNKVKIMSRHPDVDIHNRQYAS